MKFISILLLAALFLFSTCKKDHRKPPVITLKTAAGYTSSDATVAKIQNIKVGVLGDKVEDDMLTLNVSYSFDNTSTTVTAQTITLSGTEQQHFDKDITFTTRNQSGTEKWIFTITDKDGNIAQKQIVLTVQ